MKIFLEFSPLKSVALLFLSRVYRLLRPPNIYLDDNVLAYVESFKYLGHIISADLIDDHGHRKGQKKSCYWREYSGRKVGKCTFEVKCRLFRTYCSLWSRYRQSILNSLRVCLNNILRKLMGLPQWFSASSMLSNLRVQSLQEVLRNVS